MSRRRHKKSINFFSLIIFAIFCLAALLVFKNKDQFFKNNLPVIAPTTTTLNTQPISFETKNIHKNESTYIININYPYFKIDFIDSAINQFVNNQMSSFINEFGTNEIFNDNKNTLDIIFDPYLVSSNWVSLRFINAVYTGGAHGNQQIITKNFNLITKQDVQLKHLFKNDAYLTFLSNRAIEKFTNDQVSQESWIKDGASAKYDNFKNFTYSTDGQFMIFHFDPYQIAPYSAGILTLEINKTELVEFLK